MIKSIRKFLWRLLGIDYNMILRKLDYVLLKYDKYASIGKETYDNGAIVWRWTNAPLNIGKYCSIAYNVNFIVDEGYHNCSEITNYPFINNLTKDNELINYKAAFSQKEGITVGNDVWIGLNVVILAGVKIGNGVTIAAGSVVNNDIPDYTIVGGVPAKVIKHKYSDEVLTKLKKILWWDWDADIVIERRKDFYLPIEEFIRKYEN